MTRHKNFPLSFTKYQGNGNDFIIIDVDNSQSSMDSLLAWAQNNAQKLCDRYTGIGADGILLVASHEKALSMVVINQDGSLAKNCGNGLRCVAQWWMAQDKERQEVTISLAHKNYYCQKIGENILVDMGLCELFPEKALINQLGLHISSFRASIGNEHLIFFCDKKPDNLDILIKNIKNNYKDFSDYNISICYLSDNKLYSHVYERGVGFTQSCASGAVAAACAFFSMSNTFLPASIKLYQSGGIIEARVLGTVPGQNADVFFLSQLGPAQEVFQGSLKLDKGKMHEHI